MTNDNQQDIIDSGLSPTDPRESAILTTLQCRRAYTAVVAGIDGTSNNIALVEKSTISIHSTRRNCNISARGFVDTGDGVMIAGIIVGGTTAEAIVVRGLGPSLASSIANPLPNPMLTVFDSSGLRLQRMMTQQQDLGATDISASAWHRRICSKRLLSSRFCPAATLRCSPMRAAPPGSAWSEIYNVTTTQ